MDELFWSGKRPKGVQDFINYKQYSNLVKVLEDCLKRHKKKPAFTSIGHTITFEEVDQLSNFFAGYLQNCTDLRPGDRVAVQLPNILQYPVVVYGILRAGLIIVNTNPLYTPSEMVHQLKDAGIRALVFLDAFGYKVEEVTKTVDIDYLFSTRIADLLPLFKRCLINFVVTYVKRVVKPFNLKKASVMPFLKAIKQGKTFGDPELINLTRDDVAVLQYTGGTTGVSRGAMLTHGNLVANMLQIQEALKQQDSSGVAIFNHGTEVVVSPLPLYHIYAFTVHLLCFPLFGDHSVLIANPRDTDTFIRFIKPWKMTGFIGLNTLFLNLLNHKKFTSCDFSSVKFTLSGGMALKTKIAKQWHETVGCEISEGYGLTECSPVVLVNPFVEGIQLGTAGIALPDTLLRTTIEGKEVSVGTRGELCVKGPQVMKGYWNNKQATEEVFDDEGWFKTGDIAIIQENGFVKIVDRLKDMILVSGFNVYPNEIEDVVMRHEQIENCAVIGVPDEQTGEQIKLFVVAKDEKVTAQDLEDYCRIWLTAYKIPKIIVFCKELPLSSVGKVLRRQLR